MTRTRPDQCGAVLAGVQANAPPGWPPASLDTGSGRHPSATIGSRSTRSNQLRGASTVPGDCHIVVLDIRMPPTFVEVRSRFPQVGVLVLSTYTDTTVAI